MLLPLRDTCLLIAPMKGLMPTYCSHKGTHAYMLLPLVTCRALPSSTQDLQQPFSGWTVTNAPRPHYLQPLSSATNTYGIPALAIVPSTRSQAKVQPAQQKSGWKNAHYPCRLTGGRDGCLNARTWQLPAIKGPARPSLSGLHSQAHRTEVTASGRHR